MIDSEKSQPTLGMTVRQILIPLGQTFKLKELQLSGFAGTCSLERNPIQETIQRNYFNGYFLVGSV